MKNKNYFLELKKIKSQTSTLKNEMLDDIFEYLEKYGNPNIELNNPVEIYEPTDEDIVGGNDTSKYAVELMEDCIGVDNPNWGRVEEINYEDLDVYVVFDILDNLKIQFNGMEEK